MGLGDASVFEVLQQLEDELRNQYWIIRNGRRTNWKAVNRTRLLAECMCLLGVPGWAVQRARYCLRMVVCKRCYGDDLLCHANGGRAKRGDFDAEIQQ